MCQPTMAHRPTVLTGCGCGCGPGFRRFVSPQEEREWLESYRDQLKKELAGVEDHIKKSKK